ncbi:hypothetical protein G6O67_004424 [Ophiocordyceps sinensis]|uniref:DUF1279 domain-containing protein n=1 Tax=Ophiocordyceps sinensis TaxID=72228 RepID=A0A8H4PP04_9HYPO|nr:hypothetical protein G6O67_004424 [Ophiocordyceps sinensis]
MDNVEAALTEPKERDERTKTTWGRSCTLYVHLPSRFPIYKSPRDREGGSYGKRLSQLHPPTLGALGTPTKHLGSLAYADLLHSSAQLKRGAIRFCWFFSVLTEFRRHASNSPRAAGSPKGKRFIGKAGLERCLDELLRNVSRHGAKRSNTGTWGETVGRTQRRGFKFSPWRRSTNGSGQNAPAKLSLGARLKKLSKEYGWSAVGVYLGLSVLDFPFCFLLVRIVGTETIGKVEQFIVSNVKAIIPESARQKWHEYWHAVREAEKQQLGKDDISDKVEMAGWGVREAQERNEEEASLATQLALAYAIHKSFIFVRVPLTAAVTPKVVKVLRSWGWNIGKRSPR